MSTTPMQQQFQYVKLPDGSYGKFDANASDDLIKQTITQNYPDAYKQQAPAQPDPHPFISKLISMGSAVGNFGRDFGHGINKGIMQGPTTVAQGLNKLPWVGEYLAPTQGVEAMKSAVQANNPGEMTGKIAEQTGEFALPGAQEEKIASGLASKLPFLGKLAPPVARVAAAAGVSGAVNKYQGGNFGTGAIVGGGLNAGGQAMQAVAPKVAEAALGIPQRVKKYGAQPGKAVLNELTANSPAKIADQAEQKLQTLNDTATEIADHSQRQAPLAASREFVDQQISSAQNKQAPELVKKLDKIKQKLTYEYGPDGEPLMVPTQVPKTVSTGVVDEFGNPINKEAQVAGASVPKTLPDAVSASKMRAMRQGVDEEIKAWTPAGMKPDSTIEATRHQLYGVMSRGAQEAAPGTAAMDQRMSSLIPVQNYAENKALAEGVIPQVMKKMQAPTGALTGAAIGASGGYYKEGAPGALKYGALGLVAPNVLANPALWVGTARAMNAAPTFSRVVAGATLQGDRKKKKSAFYGE